MNRFYCLILNVLFSGLLAPSVLADDGLVVRESPFSVSDTADKLEAVLESKGMTVFARIDHSAGAASVDQKLAPTQVIIFGNPKVGSPLMRCAPTVAIDLPQKVLIWEQQGQVSLAYNDPQYLARRHQISGCDEIIGKIAVALDKLTAAALVP